jgi:hypothetical protein
MNINDVIDDLNKTPVKGWAPPKSNEVKVVYQSKKEKQVTKQVKKPVQPKLNPQQLERLRRAIKMAAVQIYGHFPLRDEHKDMRQLLAVALLKKEMGGEKVWGYVKPKWLEDPEAMRIVEHTVNKLQELGIQSHEVEV